MKHEPTYKELSRAKIHSRRIAVISKNNIEGGFTVGQLLTSQEDDRKGHIFLSGALHCETLESLYNLRDALNIAIEKLEKENPRPRQNN